MIVTARGADILRLLDRIEAMPSRYLRLVLCTPYVDSQMQERLVQVLLIAVGAGCAVRVITTAGVANALLGVLPGHSARWSRVVIAKRNIHAKAYVVIARKPTESEAIVGSANLTVAGVEENIELLLKMRATSELGRHLIFEIHDFLERAVAGSVNRFARSSHLRGQHERQKA